MVSGCFRIMTLTVNAVSCKFNQNEKKRNFRFESAVQIQITTSAKLHLAF